MRSVCAVRVFRAQTLWQRLRGLLGSRLLSPGCGLLFERCRAVHTFGMTRALDVVFLDRDSRVVRVASGVRPFGVVWCWHARHVLEFEVGQARPMGLIPGRHVVWTLLPWEAL